MFTAFEKIDLYSLEMCHIFSLLRIYNFKTSIVMMHMCMWILHVLCVNFNVNHTLITQSFQCSWMIFSHQFSIDPGAKRLVKAHMKMACKRNGVRLKLFHSSINTYTSMKCEPCELNSIFYRRYLSSIYIHTFRPASSKGCCLIPKDGV